MKSIEAYASFIPMNKEKSRVGKQFLNPDLQIQSPMSSLNHKAATDFVEEEYGLPHEKKFYEKGA